MSERQIVYTNRDTKEMNKMIKMEVRRNLDQVRQKAYEDAAMALFAIPSDILEKYRQQLLNGEISIQKVVCDLIEDKKFEVAVKFLAEMA